MRRREGARPGAATGASGGRPSGLRQVVKALALRRLEFEVDSVPLSFERVSPGQLANWFLTESSGFVRPARAWGLPTVIQVEPTNLCNLSCPGCPAGGEAGRERGFMNPELFTALVDELSGSLLALLLWDWGEPFLHPSAAEMVRYAANAGIKVLASSNGHVFAAGDQARRVVESGLDTLIVAVDGLEQDTYERFRRGGDLATVVEGMRRVRKVRETLGRETPRINLRFIAMRHNEHEIPELPRFAAEAGADLVTVRRFAQWGRVAELAPSRSDHALPSPFALPEGLTPLRRNPCRALWNCPTVHWDGTVCSCFMDWAGEHPLGRFGQSTFREIWSGTAYRRLRQAFRRNWRDVPKCAACSCGYAGGNVGTDSNLAPLRLPRAETGAGPDPGDGTVSA